MVESNNASANQQNQQENAEEQPTESMKAQEEPSQQPQSKEQDDENNGEAAQQQAQVEEKKEPVQPAFDKTSILLTKSHGDSKGSPECSYCHGKRDTYNGEEKDLKYHKTGFSTNKLKIEDYEVLLQQGWTRCGSYVYIRNQTKSCCECYQYKVPIKDFKMNKS